MSFYLAFNLAMRARNVSGVDRSRIYAAIRARLRSAPLSFSDLNAHGLPESLLCVPRVLTPPDTGGDRRNVLTHILLQPVESGGTSKTSL